MMNEKGGWLGFYINVKDFRVLVIGGGEVGSRRALWFRRAGSRVTVAAKDFSDNIINFNDITKVYVDVDNEEDWNILKKLIKNNDIIVIAIDHKTNEIVDISKKYNKIINNAVDAMQGNLIVPFQFKTSYGLRVSVTSLGEAGVAARIILGEIYSVVESERSKTLYRVFKKYKIILKSNIYNIKERMKKYFIPEKDIKFWRYINQLDERKALERALELAGLDAVDNPIDNTDRTSVK